jgi:hypothetical protein
MFLMHTSVSQALCFIIMKKFILLFTSWLIFVCL